MQKAKRRNKKGKAMGRIVMGIKRELIKKDSRMSWRGV